MGRDCLRVRDVPSYCNEEDVLTISVAIVSVLSVGVFVFNYRGLRDKIFSWRARSLTAYRLYEE